MAKRTVHLTGKLKYNKYEKSQKINHNGHDVINTVRNSNNQKINNKNRYKQPQQKYKKITKKYEKNTK